VFSKPSESTACSECLEPYNVECSASKNVDRCKTTSGEDMIALAVLKLYQPHLILMMSPHVRLMGGLTKK